MPSIPKKVELQGNSVDIVNGVRNSLADEYKQVLPAVVQVGDILPNGKAATQEDATLSLRAFGNALLNFQPAQNSFIYNLVNRIGRVIISSRLYRNPWAVFKKGYLEMGDTIEEIFVRLTEAHQFDPETAETEVFKQEIPKVDVAYHRMNYQKFYKVTIRRDELRQAFLSMAGVTDLIAKIIETLYTSANYDEFIMTKYMIANAALNGRMAPVTIPAVSMANADAIMVVLKGISDKLQYMSTSYNYAGVSTYSNRDYQYFIFNTEMSANIDVGALSRAFNLDKVELMGRVIGVDSFTFNPAELRRLSVLMYDNPNQTIFTTTELNTLKTIPAVVVDRAWFMIFDNLEDMRQQPNEQGLYWNHFYHVWKTFSTSPFNNAIAFTTTESTVTAVSITPATVTSPANSNVQFTATVTKTGLSMGSVGWSISGQQSSTTFIDSNGLLHISPHETASTITVTAFSTEVEGITGTATVTVGTPSTPGE